MTSNSNTPHSLKQTKIEQIPHYLRFNPRIVRGYRVGYNTQSLMKSLFQWHNQTINTWTHLIGSLVIFIIIFSSNLFTQHYHTKHQILRFSELMQNHQLNISQIKNLTQSDLSLISSIQSIGLELTQAVGEIQKQIGLFLKLTQEDNVIYRQILYSRLQFLKIFEVNIQEIIINFTFEKQITLIQNSIHEIKEIIETKQFQLNQFLTEIINLIEKIAEKVNPIPKWPLLVFLFSASICLTFSFTFHLFHPHSQKLYKILRKLDFSGVILLIVGSSFPFFAYGAACRSTLSMSYLTIMSITGIIVFGLLVSGYFDPKQRQKQKSLLFGLFGVSFIIPISHILILEKLDQIQDSLLFSQFAKRALIFGGIYLLGLLIYTVQCPERYIEGKFDYCGASHQIWHLLVLIALYFTYELNWDIYYERRVSSCLAS